MTIKQKVWHAAKTLNEFTSINSVTHLHMNKYYKHFRIFTHIYTHIHTHAHNRLKEKTPTQLK